MKTFINFRPTTPLHYAKERWCDYLKPHSKLNTPNKKADIQRKLAEQRKIRAGEITNLILSKGNNIICNNYNFKVAQMKKKEIETNKNGKNFSKKKAGKNISYSAPSSILTMLDNKLEARGYNKIQRVDIDKSAKITSQNRILKAQELFLQIEN